MSAQLPESTDAAWADDWSVALRIWIERAGETLLDPERLDLLESIDGCHSISGAARQLGISYRHAWELVKAVNDCSATPLVVSLTGGAGGGGAELTPLGRWTVALFRRVRQHLNEQASHLLGRLLTSPTSPGLHVAAAVSLQEVLDQLLTAYSLKNPKIRVRAVYGGSDELADQILSGSPIDVFLSADPRQIDRLVEAKIVEPRGRFSLAENGLALIAHRANRLPIRRLSDLRKAPIRRLAIANESCPLGRYSLALLQSRGLSEELADRILFVDHSAAVCSSVGSGQADAGLIYSSDVRRAADCRMLFLVDELPEPIVYSAAVLLRDGGAEAHRLTEFLRKRDSQRRWRACGFLPAKSA